MGGVGGEKVGAGWGGGITLVLFGAHLSVLEPTILLAGTAKYFLFLRITCDIFSSKLSLLRFSFWLFFPRLLFPNYCFCGA